MLSPQQSCHYLIYIFLIELKFIDIRYKISYIYTIN
jgi:hypothetical protein